MYTASHSYQANALFTLRALAELEHVNTELAFREAVAWLQSRRRDDGRWNGASPYGSRTWTQLEARRRPSKWVTWQALYIIQAARAGLDLTSRTSPTSG